MSEKLGERRCVFLHDAKPRWILVCGDLSCNANILADETECDPYIAALEAKLEAMECLERAAAALEEFERRRYELPSDVMGEGSTFYWNELRKALAAAQQEEQGDE